MLFQTSRRRHKVYRLRPGTTTDSYGDPVTSWDVPARDQIRDAVVTDPTTSEDGTPVRVLVTDELVLYVPRAYDLTEDDRVEVDGETWTVEGHARIYKGLTGQHTAARLLRLNGGSNG